LRFFASVLAPTETFRLEARKKLFDDDGPLSMRQQARLLGISWSTLHYKPAEPKPRDITLMRLLDEQYTDTPFYGVRRMTEHLKGCGYAVGRDHTRALLRRMGITAIFPTRNLSMPNPAHRIYPYLLRGLEITRPNQVWTADIIYVRLAHGFAYLTAVIDWHSRFVLSWRL